MKKQLFLRRLGRLGFAFFLIKGLIWLGIFLGAFSFFKPKSTMQTTDEQLRVDVYDTYVMRKNGTIMHFDILVDSREKDFEKVCDYGRQFLAEKGEAGQPLTAKQCRFCHVERATAAMEKSIAERGFFIIEMEGCN